LPEPIATPLGLATPIGLVAPSSTPLPQPTAFAQTNVFTFGSAPQSNFARSTDPVQIFYATLSPTVVSNATPVRIAAVTTSNANTVKLQVGTQTISLVQTGAGQWQAAFPFPLSAVPVGQSTLQLSLVASRSDGSSATVPIPINVSTPP
jgi:hypothetical protein